MKSKRGVHVVRRGQRIQQNQSFILRSAQAAILFLPVVRNSLTPKGVSSALQKNMGK